MHVFLRQERSEIGNGAFFKSGEVSSFYQG